MLLPRIVCLGLLACAPVLAQTDPGWWPGVIRSGDSHAVGENYAPANLGQLKNMADQARLHLDAYLTGFGGAGVDITNMVAGWTGPVADNYAPINLGQLKAVADKFYTRLDAVGFDYKSQLITNGYSGVWTGTPLRPWDEASPTSVNYAPANLGQLKILFSFDLTVDGADSLPDWWEKKYFSGTTGHSPTADDDGDGLTNLQEFQAHGNPKDYFDRGGGVTIVPRVFVFSGGGAHVELGQYSAKPIVYKIVNAATGEPLVNAPVTVSVTGRGLIIAVSGGGAAGTSLVLPSDSNGKVQVYFIAPNS